MLVLPLSEKQLIEELTKLMKTEEKSKNIDDMTANELKNYVKELEEYKNKDGKIIQDWKNRLRFNRSIQSLQCLKHI